MALPILLVVACLALLILEVFIVSFGAISVVAITCGVSGVLLAFRESAPFGWILVGTLVVGAPLVLWSAFRLLPRLAFAKGLYLEAPRLSHDERAAAAPALKELLGAVGETTSPLRPSGTALFAGEPHQVMTKGTAVPPGVRVRVIDVSGNRIVVEPLEES